MESVRVEFLLSHSNNVLLFSWAACVVLLSLCGVEKLWLCVFFWVWEGKTFVCIFSSVKK